MMRAEEFYGSPNIKYIHIYLKIPVECLEDIVTDTYPVAVAFLGIFENRFVIII